MTSEPMVGGDGAHSPEHRRTPYCEYMRCTPVNPNFVDCVEPRGCECTDAQAVCDTCAGAPASVTFQVDHSPPTPLYDPPPKHYEGDGKMDPWAVWDAFDLDRYTANAVKYLLRAGKKDIAPRLDDLRKAANYVAKAIEMEERRAD